MKKNIHLSLILIALLFTNLFSSGQTSGLSFKLDSLLQDSNTAPFNGVVLIKQKGKILYSKTMGYANLEKKIPLQFNDPFVIGSVSKQITAVLLLKEVECQHIKLTTPITVYLPELQKKWPADTITVLQLLTHTHGIIALDQPLRFKPGTQFLYSQIGYELLARIIEKTSGKSFAQASDELFHTCLMKHSTHPDHKPADLVMGYTEQTDGSIQAEKTSFENYPAAGSFISTAADLDLWNTSLHDGKLLHDKIYQEMISKQKNAIRYHPLFGQTFYGLGITVDDAEGLLQFGQTGFAPGFVSMNFYYPETKTSIIVLENIAYHTADLKQTFFYHTAILKIVRKAILSNK